MSYIILDSFIEDLQKALNFICNAISNKTTSNILKPVPVRVNKSNYYQKFNWQSLD